MAFIDLSNICAGDEIRLDKVSNEIVSELFYFAREINCKLIRIDHYTYYFKSELFTLRNKRIDGLINN